MLLNIRKQKNGTIVLTSPDGTVYPFKLEADKENEFFQDIGKTVLEVLADPDQPTETVSAGQVTQGGVPVNNSGHAEGHLRGLMESLLPGSSKILDGMQNASYGGGEDDG